MSKIISITGDVLGSASGLTNATTNVSTLAATQPLVGEVLQALSSTTAEWAAVGNVKSSQTGTSTNEIVVFANADGVTLLQSNIITDNIYHKGTFTAKGQLISSAAADQTALLGVGTNGQVLTADSVETAGMKWATPAAVDNNFTVRQATVTGAILSTDNIINMENPAVATMTLPPLATNSGKTIIVIKGTLNDVTVQGNGAELILNGGLASNTIVLTGSANERLMLVSDGLKWYAM